MALVKLALFLVRIDPKLENGCCANVKGDICRTSVLKGQGFQARVDELEKKPFDTLIHKTVVTYISTVKIKIKQQLINSYFTIARF